MKKAFATVGIMWAEGRKMNTIDIDLCIQLDTAAWGQIDIPFPTTTTKKKSNEKDWTIACLVILFLFLSITCTYYTLKYRVIEDITGVDKSMLLIRICFEFGIRSGYLFVKYNVKIDWHQKDIDTPSYYLCGFCVLVMRIFFFLPNINHI